MHIHTSSIDQIHQNIKILKQLTKFKALQIFILVLKMSTPQSRQMITNRRKQEESYRQMDAINSDNKKQFLVANFEIKTDLKINRKKQMEEAYQSKLFNDQKLQTRRQDLAALYNQEMERWKLELLSKVETVEERKQRIMEKAYELKQSREQEKQKLIQDCYDRQWRDANDDARTLDSAALQTFVNNERMQQLEEKKNRNQKLTIEENEWLQQWRRQLDLMEQQEIGDRAYRFNNEVLTKEQIKEQIRLKKEREAEEFAKRREYELKSLSEVRSKMMEDEEKFAKKNYDDKIRGKWELILI